MAKTKNSGFSMIEIIIAISILTLLLTPIIRQLTNTMNINRKAKEQQYENENAEYVLQYFQSVDLDSIPTSTATDADIKYNEATSHIVSPANGKNKTCEVYYIDGDNIERLKEKDNTGAWVDCTVTYSSYIYELNNVKLGSRQTEYTRTVVLDDLLNVIQSLDPKDGYSYKVAYQISDAVLNNASGWTRTSEGNLVKDTDGDGCVDAILCKRVDKNEVQDPNTVNIGNMHDLDSSNVALITGYTTNFDKQVADDFYVLTMAYMKNSEDPNMLARWEMEMEDPGSILNEDIYTKNISKLTEISIDNNTTAKKFVIGVNVTYENFIELEEGKGFTISKTYPAFSQDFPYDDANTAKCPEIYFEFQPYVSETTSTGSEKTVRYSPVEYILVTNKVEGAKMYFYKPAWDQVMQTFHPGIVTNNTTASTSTASAAAIVKTVADYGYLNNYFVDNSSLNENRSDTDITSGRVEINFGSTIRPDDVTNYKNIEIYTNMDPDLTSADPQFVVNNHVAFNSKFKVKVGNASQSRVVYDLKADSIRAWNTEKSNKDRLYTVTVTIKPVSAVANTVELTGARGGY